MNWKDVDILEWVEEFASENEMISDPYQLSVEFMEYSGGLYTELEFEHFKDKLIEEGQLHPAQRDYQFREDVLKEYVTIPTKLMMPRQWTYHKNKKETYGKWYVTEFSDMEHIQYLDKDSKLQKKAIPNGYFKSEKAAWKAIAKYYFNYITGGTK